ncbi:DUF421 domain-containing protein [Sphingosinicella rhizophila]|uniref:DUF421 domain-containing protein n=1 Tax=Sphingosinicella rhizophila TaxID=3050082 RepID=A0ABU3Q5X5_9SPHN|nr:YetF domain-containing protein [Sphingosinicella sp. GR2756]MDT9598707.1 DUF421 domain-containing protein [Sphingosinicella sp. GR2756]
MLRGVAIYILVLIVIRISGRRTMAQMTPFDLVLLLIIAETTQQGLLGDDFSITNSAILIVTLFSLDIALSYVKQFFPAVDKFVDGRPTLLIANGKPDEEALQWSRVGMDDVMSAARAQHGLERLEQVKHAILETDGNLSIIPK